MRTARGWTSSYPAHIRETGRSVCFGEVLNRVGRRGTCACLVSDMGIVMWVSDSSDLKVSAV